MFFNSVGKKFCCRDYVGFCCKYSVEKNYVGFCWYRKKRTPRASCMRRESFTVYPKGTTMKKIFNLPLVIFYEFVVSCRLNTEAASTLHGEMAAH